MLGNLNYDNMIAELHAIEAKTRRIAEKNAALDADSKEYHISPESREALARGDRQRETGVYNGVNFITCAWCGKLVDDITGLHKGYALEAECPSNDLSRFDDDGGNHHV